MNPRLKPPSERKAKLTKEQKLQKIEQFTKEIEELRNKRDNASTPEEKKEYQRLFQNKTAQRFKVKQSLETFYPENPINMRQMVINKRQKQFEDFKKEKLQEMDTLIKHGFKEKAKQFQEQLYYTELRYKYQYAAV